MRGPTSVIFFLLILYIVCVAPYAFTSGVVETLEDLCKCHFGKLGYYATMAGLYVGTFGLAYKAFKK